MTRQYLYQERKTGQFILIECQDGAPKRLEGFHCFGQAAEIVAEWSRLKGSIRYRSPKEIQEAKEGLGRMMEIKEQDRKSKLNND